MFRSVFVDFVLLLVWWPLLFPVTLFYTTSSLPFSHALTIDRKQPSWRQSNHQNYHIKSSLSNDDNKPSSNLHDEKKPNKSLFGQLKKSLNSAFGKSDKVLPPPNPVDNRTIINAKTKSPCCTRSTGEIMSMALFTVVIAVLLLSLIFYVFSCVNRCTCRYLVNEFKDNLKSAGINKMKLADKEEYFYKKHRKQLAKLSSNQSNLEDGDGTSTAGSGWTRFWPFGKEKSEKDSWSDSPLGSSATLSTESLRNYDKP